ncbi:MAG: NosR/NirI family nitrous oxide reductase transcriptional regulator [Candidatus Latescibacterota bacterium]|jgi:NosR/NirI family nitrous oxide reductase transcriptional regulator
MSIALACLLGLLATALPVEAVSHLELRDGRPICLPQEHVPDVFAGAQWQAIEMAGKPVMEARVDGERVGFVFLTHEFVDMVAYSGKPLEILVALSATGTIERADLMDHHEPILLVGIPEKVLHDYIDQFEGRHIEDLLLENIAGESKILLDGVSGATVTALVADQVVFTAAKIVAQEIGLLAVGGKTKARISEQMEMLGWQQLMGKGLLEHVSLSAAEVRGQEYANEDDWLDLYVGILNQPSLGANLLGEEAYQALMASHPGKALLVILNNGSFSFRGSGFVRGGIFDRLQLTQGLEIIRFRDSDYHYQFRIVLEDAPHIGEKAIYIVPNDAFNGALPWELEVLVTERSHETSKSKKFMHFKVPYEMPAEYVIAPPAAFGELTSPSMAARIWSGKKVWIGLYIALWAIVLLSFALRERISKNRKFLEYFHLAIIACSILLLGIGQKGQPSVVNIFTFVDVLRSGSGLGLFLTEPFLFVSWLMITVGTLLWGRGPFCGWICPYGGMLELTHFVRNKLVPKKWHKLYEMPASWHDRLKYLPYFIFVSLLTVSLFSLNLAEMLAEIEPFKTTWLVGVTNRPWYLVLYWSWLFIMGAVTVRFFCRYLCPLGAYLAILSRFQIFRLPRRNFCTTCNICAKGCSTRAINAQGEIDPKTCFGCLECTNTMSDEEVCPPLLKIEIWEKYEEGDRVAS